MLHSRVRRVCFFLSQVNFFITTSNWTDESYTTLTWDLKKIVFCVEKTKLVILFFHRQKKYFEIAVIIFSFSFSSRRSKSAGSELKKRANRNEIKLQCNFYYTRLITEEKKNYSKEAIKKKNFRQCT